MIQMTERWKFRCASVLGSLALFAAGCATMDAGRTEMRSSTVREGRVSTETDKGSVPGETSGAPRSATSRETESIRADYEARIHDLEARLKVIDAARANAVDEVLRLRARIGTLAAGPETSAMFAEARVIVDRMEEDAFNQAGADFLLMAQKYLKDGKKSMEEGNFGGAAFLFEMVTATYQDFRKSSPRSLVVLSDQVVLRGGPSAASEKTGTLERGAVVEGIEKRDGWFRVKGPGGVFGWLKKESVH